jgi:hypothetical protein
MKSGKSLQELAAEIQRQSESKVDYVAPSSKIELVEESPGKVSLQLIGREVGDRATYGINNSAHGQLAEYTGIPKAYYDQMREKAPQLLADNVNTWLGQLGAKGDKRLVRTLDGNVRGLLSDRYRPLDNYDLASAVLPVIQKQGLQIVSCEMTERRLYIKAFNSALAREIEFAGRDVMRKDECSPVICISNSEIGFGSLSITAGIFTKGCTNLAFFDDSKMRKYHVGKGAGDIEAIQAVLTDRTKSLTDAAVWAQVRDIVGSAFSEERFATLIDRVQETTDQKIEGDVIKAVNLTGDKFGFTKAESKGVLDHLIRGGDLSRYGLFNAVTRMAEDLPDYDRATEVERFGGKVIELPRNEWELIAQAA